MLDAVLVATADGSMGAVGAYGDLVWIVLIGFGIVAFSAVMVVLIASMFSRRKPLEDALERRLTDDEPPDV